MRPARLLVMLSGGGRTLGYLCEAIGDGRLNAKIVCVVASRECAGAEKARARGFETRVIPGRLDPGVLDALCDGFEVDWVVLAGYLKLVPITRRVRGRVVNIHPALLPDFGGDGMHGMRVHEAVVAAAKDGRVKETGCTVHLADEVYDSGKVLARMRCPVGPGDTAEAVADRVFALERVCYVNALQKLIDSEQRVGGSGG